MKEQFAVVRKVFLLILVIMLGVLINGCGTTNTGADKQTKQEPVVQEKADLPPFKVGVLLPYTGPYAMLSEHQEDGMRFFFEQVGYQAGGRKIELIVEDTQLNAQVGLQKLRGLVERDKIDLLTGVVSSQVAYAIKDYVISQRLPFIISNAGANDLTRDDRSEYIFRTSFTNAQYQAPLGPYAYNELGLRKMVTIASDYSAGYEKTEGFVTPFEKAGGQVVREIYAPLGTTDFSPYLLQINPNEVDGIFAFIVGADGLRFVKQFDEYGLKDKLQLIGDGGMVAEDILDALGDSAVGLITGINYSSFIDTPENKSFVAEFQQKQRSKQRPTFYAYQGYLAARVIVEALEQVEGKTDDQKAFLDAIRKIEFIGPGGNFAFDPKTQNIIFDNFIMKTETKDGKVQNTIIKTLPKTPDPWTPK